MLTKSEVLGVLQKIINLTSRQNGNDVVRLSRWLRCLFNLTLSLDEKISLKCLDQATQIAAKKQGVRSSHSAQLYRYQSTSSLHTEIAHRWQSSLYNPLL